MRPLIFASALLTGSIAHAQSTDKFDLECTGTITQSIGENESSGPWTEKMTVDLSAGKWCKGTCYYVNPIVSADHDEIVLDDSSSSANSNEEVLDRRTGTYRQEMLSTLGGGIVRRAGGSCKVKPFSGFPARKF